MTTLPRTPLEDWIRSKIDLPAGAVLSRRSLAAYQLVKLRQTLDYVKDCSPFYRQRFSALDTGSVRSLADLAQWPLTTGDDLRSDPLAFLCISQSAVERVVTLPTRSPRQQPKRLFFSSADLELAVDFFHHGFSTNVAAGQRMLVMMPCRQPYSVGDLLSRGLARIPVHTIAHGPLESPEAVVDAVLRHHVDQRRLRQHPA